MTHTLPLLRRSERFAGWTAIVAVATLVIFAALASACGRNDDMDGMDHRDKPMPPGDSK